jgi:ABC-type uncharacterized transport system permease subunit
VEWFAERTWYALAVACYGVATAHGVMLWRRGWQRGEWLNYGMMALGFCAHTVALMGRGFSLKQCPVTNLFEALMFVTWALSAAYLVMGVVGARVRFVSVFLAPVLMAAGFVALQPRLDEPGPNFDLERTAVSLHVSLVLLAYAAFGLASLVGVLFLIRDRPGGSEAARNWSARLPDSGRLEVVLLRALGLGLILLTAGLVMSFGLMRERYGVLVRPDPKIAWSILVWAVYLGLVVSRLRFGQAPHRLAWGALGGFVFVVLTFWGTNLLSPIHHP